MSLSSEFLQMLSLRMEENRIAASSDVTANQILFGLLSGTADGSLRFLEPAQSHPAGSFLLFGWHKSAHPLRR
jgi:hypothetical protein